MSECQPANLPVPVNGAGPVKASPRPVIHAFCEDQGTAALIAAASLDRRLVQAHVSAQMGGVHAACTAYASLSTPDMIVVESLLDPPAMLADLERLADVCDAGTKVIVIGHVNDVLLYRELLRRHISDYLVVPLFASQLAECVADAISGEDTAPLGRIIAFLGAKVGAGSSTVCHNVAWTLAEGLGSETVIADFDLAFGTLGLDFNQDSQRGMGDALAAGERLDAAMIGKLLTKCSSRLSLLTAPCALDRDTAIDTGAAVHVAELLAENAPFVVLDMPRAWSEWARRLVEQADEIVITAEPDLASLRNAKNLVDTLRVARGVERSPLLVLNKVNMPRRPEISLRDFAGAMDQRPAVTVEFDAQLFGAAANNGQMAAEISARCRAAGAFRELASTVSGKNVPLPRSDGLLGPLIDRLGRRQAG